MIFCENCGLLLPAGAGRCPRCGAPAPAPGRTEAEAPAPQPHYTGASVPPANTLTMGGYLLYLCLFSIPLAGFVIALVFAFGHHPNAARRRFARAMVLFQLIVTGVLLLLYCIAGLAAFWIMGPFSSGPWM